MKKETYDKKIRLWISILKKMGISDDHCRDICHTHFLKQMTQKSKSTIRQTAIDYARKNFGDDRVAYKHHMIEMADDPTTPLEELEKKRRFENHMRRLNHKEKCLARNLLTHKTRKGIARRMRCCEPRISQMITTLRAKLAKLDPT